MGKNVLYLDEHGKPVALRINGEIIPQLEPSISIDYGEYSIPRVHATFIVPGLICEYVEASGVKELLHGEPSSTEASSK